jgi:hypothetical protein
MSVSVPEEPPAAVAPAVGVIGLGAMGPAWRLRCAVPGAGRMSTTCAPLLDAKGRPRGRTRHAREDDSAVIKIFPGITLPERRS